MQNLKIKLIVIVKNENVLASLNNSWSLEAREGQLCSKNHLYSYKKMHSQREAKSFRDLRFLSITLNRYPKRKGRMSSFFLKAYRQL